MTDGALLDLARSGDEAAFAELVRPHRRELHLHCYRLLGSFDDADDALQETWSRPGVDSRLSRPRRRCAPGCTASRPIPA